jgi:hypothetical protein
MSDEFLTAKDAKTALPQTTNTPEMLGVTPRYVLQHNGISRGAHTLSATAQKLAAMAMALLPPDLSSLTAAFTFPDFCKALGMPIGGETYEIFKAAVDECMESVITLETKPDEKGKKNWKKFTWFTVLTFSEKTSKATMTFSSELAEFLAAIKWLYAKINLKDLGELQSRYSIHLFEIAMSYRSLAGKNGNRGETWYFERGFPDEIRKIMGVAEDDYKNNYELKRNVIERPIREINEAGIGLEITPVTVKQGRRIVAIWFDCKPAPRPVRGRKKSAVAELPPPPPEVDFQAEQEREEKELAHLAELYPDEFAERYQAAMDSRPAFLKQSTTGAVFAEQRALLELREKYGIMK